MAKSALKKRASSSKPQLTLADELARIAKRAQTSTLAFGSAIALLDPGTGDFFCSARSGAMAPPLGMRLQVEHSFTGLCIQSGEILHCKDSETDERVDTAVIRALGVRSIVAAPIKDQSAVIGVFAVFSPVCGAFSDIHVSALKTAADHVAALVQGDHNASVPETRTAIVEAATAETQLAVSPVAQMARRSGLALATPYRKPPAPATSLHKNVSARTLILVTAVAALLIVGARPFLKTYKLRLRAARHHARAVRTQPAAASLQPAPVSVRPTAPLPPVSTQVIAAPPVSSQVIAADLAKAPIPATRSRETPTQPSALSRIRTARSATQIQVEPKPVTPEESQAAPTVPPPTAQAAVVSATPPPSLASVPPSSNLSAILEPAPSLPRQVQVHESQPPQLVRSVPIVYPEFARERRIRSRVLVKATIASDGTVAKAEFAGGLPVFRDAALEAVRHRRYKPAMRDGQPVEQQIEIQLDFHP